MSDAAGADTIFALSSGLPPAAIAIVRVSGPAAGAMLRTVCGDIPEPRTATLRPVRRADGALIDRALTLWFPGPATATGEDLAELHLHGGRAVVAAVLAVLGDMPGCRPAAAGEFTRRAFDNGRIDLLQAEGLADLLSAETEGARTRAMRLAEGGLSRLVGSWRERLVMLCARIEAVLEFGGDDPDIAPDLLLEQDVARLVNDLESALAAPPAERLRDGVRVVLAGPPNAGKSSLINALAGRDVALATPVPGTTRDLVEAPVTIDGVALVLIDSAGLREGQDEVEQLGIAKAQRAIREADIVLWLGDPGEAPATASLLSLRAKADLPHGPATGFNLEVSAATGQGMAELRRELVRRATSLLPIGDVSFTEMQRQWVEDAAAELGGFAHDRDEVLRAERLRLAAIALDQLSGHYAVEPMLDALFGRFCIGK